MMKTRKGLNMQKIYCMSITTCAGKVINYTLTTKLKFRKMEKPRFYETRILWKVERFVNDMTELYNNLHGCNFVETSKIKGLNKERI